MRTISALLLMILASLTLSIAHADSSRIELRVVDAGSLELPTRDGKKIHVGAPIVAPFTVTHADAAGARVDVEVDAATASALERATAAERGQRVAIVVHGTVESTPTIKEAIRGGKLAITLRSPDQAAQLARALTAK